MTKNQLITKNSFEFKNFYYHNKVLIESFEEYLSYINFLTMKKNFFETDCLWYRGDSSSKYDELLHPSIYRPTVWATYNSKVEKDIFDTFKNKAQAYKKQKELSNWNWYFIMQHYGLPTRLLDWTEGHLFALFFAVHNAPSTNVDEPCVWIIDPIAINNISQQKETIFFASQIDNTEYLPDKNSLCGKQPMALYPPYEDERIRVQKSCFTIHGKEKEGFQNLYKQNKDLKILQLRFKKDIALDIKLKLHYAGINESVLFPDLGGLARELKYIYGMQ